MEYGADEVLETAVEAGHILLENGAEIFRVEETMKRISRHFGVDEGHKDFFVLTTAIFATGGAGDAKYATVRPSPVRSAHLNRVEAINQLSREIEQGEYTLPEVRERLREIKRMGGFTPALKIFSAGVGAAAFSCMFGGGFLDAAAAFFAGLILYVFMLFVAERHLTKITGNLFGAAIVTVVSIICYKAGFGHSLSHMIIGSIIPLVPGLNFTNGIRDIADGDYISGSVRLLDAILVFLSIAIGVGLVLTIYRHIWGGTLL